MNAPASSTTVAPTKVQSIADVGAFLGTRMKQIKSVIASNVTPEKMARIALNELRNNDYLAKIAIQNPESFVNAVVQASHLGLEIGGALGQAYLVPYKGEIKMMPGYRGLISLARRSGEITSIRAEIAYEHDEFDLTLGTEVKVTHKPKLDGDRGQPRLAYMVAQFKDGGHHFEWMSIAEVMSIKARSSAVQAGKKTPWDTDRDEMIRKTVIRRGWKYLPMSIEMQVAAQIETANEQGQSVVIDGDAVIVTSDDHGDGHDEAVKPAWADEQFNKNLPNWLALIAKKTKTVDEVITMANTKGPLTAEQIAVLRNKSAQSADGSAQAGGGAGAAASNPALTDADKLIDKIRLSTDVDSLDAHADLIGTLPEEDRAKVTAFYKAQREALVNAR